MGVSRRSTSNAFPCFFTVGQAERKAAQQPRLPHVRVGESGGLDERPRSAGETKGHRDGAVPALRPPEARRGESTTGLVLVYGRVNILVVWVVVPMA